MPGLPLKFALSVKSVKEIGAPKTLGKGIEPQAQPRFIAGGRVAMKNTLLDHTVQQGQSGNHQTFGARLIVGVQRLAKLADLVPHASAVGPVPFSLFARLPETLQSGFMVCHRISFAKAMNKTA
jgi:hypothetical protein